MMATAGRNMLGVLRIFILNWSRVKELLFTLTYEISFNYGNAEVIIFTAFAKN
jgi:hypothetical protein